MTWMLLALGLVIVAISEASKPANWRWLSEMGSDRQQKHGAASDAGKLTRSPEIEPPLPPGEFRVVERKEADSADPSTTTATEPSPPGEKPGLQIPAAILKTIEDHSIGIRSGERDAYFTILARARDLPEKTLDQAATSDVGYAELLNDSERHRGRIITLTGEMRRFLPLPAGSNDHGINTLYDGWMFTDDAGKKSPYRIIISEKPEGFPEGEQIRERVRFTGYSFKRYTYETAHGLHSAPLLLGARIHWSRPVPRTDDSRGAAPYIVVTLSVLALAFGAAYYWLCSADRRLQSARKLREPTPEALAQLGQIESHDVSTFLKDLGDRADDPPRNPPG